MDPPQSPHSVSTQFYIFRLLPALHPSAQAPPSCPPGSTQASQSSELPSSPRALDGPSNPSPTVTAANRSPAAPQQSLDSKPSSPRACGGPSQALSLHIGSAAPPVHIGPPASWCWKERISGWHRFSLGTEGTEGAGGQEGIKDSRKGTPCLPWTRLFMLTSQAAPPGTFQEPEAANCRESS